MSDEAHSGGIDVDRLMDDLKRRVAARRAAGELDPRVLDLPFSAMEEPPDAAGVAVRLRPETAYSSKRGVGQAITLAKRVQIKFLFHFLNDLVEQINRALRRTDERLERQETTIQRLQARVERLEAEHRGEPTGANDAGDHPPR